MAMIDRVSELIFCSYSFAYFTDEKLWSSCGLIWFHLMQLLTLVEIESRAQFSQMLFESNSLKLRSVLDLQFGGEGQ